MTGKPQKQRVQGKVLLDCAPEIASTFVLSWNNESSAAVSPTWLRRHPRYHEARASHRGCRYRQIGSRAVSDTRFVSERKFWVRI